MSIDQTQKSPTSLEVIKQFIDKSVPDSKCPFCGHPNLIIDGDNEKDIPRFVDVFKVSIKDEGKKFEASLDSPLVATPMIKLMCPNCGYTMFLDFNILTRKIMNSSDSHFEEEQ